MPEYLVRSGGLCAVVEADNEGAAIHSAIANWKDTPAAAHCPGCECPDDDVLQLGAVTQVLPLDLCDDRIVYLPTASMLTKMGFEEPESCGFAVATTTVS